jgi:hypothetical protein
MDPIVHEDYQLKLGVAEGNAFLELDAKRLSAQALKDLREDVEVVREYALKNGFDFIFVHTQDKRLISLWNRIKPCYDIVCPAPGNWVGAWLVEEKE